MANSEAGLVCFLYGTRGNKDLCREKQTSLDHNLCNSTSPFYGWSFCCRFCTGPVCRSVLGSASRKIALMMVHLAKTGLSAYANSGLPSVHLPALGWTPLGCVWHCAVFHGRECGCSPHWCLPRSRTVVATTFAIFSCSCMPSSSGLHNVYGTHVGIVLLHA